MRVKCLQVGEILSPSVNVGLLVVLKKRPNLFPDQVTYRVTKFFNVYYDRVVVQFQWCISASVVLRVVICASTGWVRVR